MFTFLSPKTAAVAPKKLGPDCTSCGLLSKCRHPKQIPQATGKTVIVIDSPEDRKDGLLYDEQLIALLAKHNFSINDCVLVPASACPGENPESWRHCQPLLIENIKRINPETIIVLGKDANASMIDWLWQHPAELPDRWFGRRIPSRELNAWVYPIGRAAYKKNPTVSQIQHFRWLRHALRSAGRPYDVVPNYAEMVEIPQYLDTVLAALKAASSSTFSAFDYETNHLKCTKPGAKIYSASVAWLEGDKPKCVAFMMEEGLREAWKAYLLSDSYKVGANIKFEDRFSRHMYSVEVKNWAWDSMIASHMADPQMGITGLKFQAFVSLGLPFYAGSVEKAFKTETAEGFNSIHQISPNDLLLYNGIDSLAELDLSILQMREAGKQSKYWNTTLPNQRYYEFGHLGC